jgi:hypothetical protein
MPIGVVWGRLLLSGPIGFSGFETRQLRIDISQQLFLDGLTEKSAAKGIDHCIFFHRLQMQSSSL